MVDCPKWIWCGVTAALGRIIAVRRVNQLAVDVKKSVYLSRVISKAGCATG